MKRIRIILSALIMFVITVPLSAQVYYPMNFLVVDQATGQPLKNAEVSIKELGYQSNITGSDGKIYFENVPVGEITFIAKCSGYVGKDGQFNITSETKSNSYKIELAAMPKPQATKVLISGEVTNKEGREIGKAQVELRAGNAVQKTVTDESGNFNVEFNLDAIQYNVPEFILEITKNDCKYKESLSIPKNNYLYKEIKMDCGNDLEGNSAPQVKKEQIGEWDFEIEGCKKSGNVITCSFLIKSNFRDRNINLSRNQTKMFDDFGNEYYPKQIGIANINTTNQCCLERKIVANIAIEAYAVFENVSTRATKITLIDLVVSGDDLSVDKIQFRDILIK